ncbi:MAG TPA: NAD(P)-binding domain-containing protein [Thermodesulfobacteriota bacterium]|nr:NAD(P)-binding domain-containing protein [Thermodesulfobacteriota bacterium]
MKKRKEIGFVGTGNMAEALIAGLLRVKFTAAEQIMAFDTELRLPDCINLKKEVCGKY